MKKLMTLSMLLLAAVSTADTCLPGTVEGNMAWINPPFLGNIKSVLPDDYKGGICEDQVYVDGFKGTRADYAYFMPEVGDTSAGYIYNFSIDFAEVLSQIGTGNRIQFYELFADLGPNGTRPFDSEFKILKIRIKKNPLTKGGMKWKVHLLWLDRPDASGNVQQYPGHFVWLPGDIDHGILNFSVYSNPHTISGTITNVSLRSELFTLGKDGNPVPVLLDRGPDANGISNPADFGQTFHFESPYQIKSAYISQAKLGIISHDLGVNFGDGITFYTPYR